MEKPDKTVFVVDTPINGPDDDRTVTSYEICGSLRALRKLTIVVSREVEMPAILAHLQRMWDSGTHQAQNTHPDMETGSAPSIP